MALTRLNEFLDGTALIGSELRAEIDQILNNFVDGLTPLTGNVDINLKILSNLVIERLSSDPGTATAGRMFQLSTNDKIRIANGSTWTNAAGGVLQSISFGGDMDGTGLFISANGLSSQADLASGDITRHGVVAGTISQMAFYHQGDLSSNNATIKIHVDQAVQKTLTASGAATSVDIFSDIAVTVTDTDEIEVEFDAGSTNPGRSIAVITIE